MASITCPKCGQNLRSNARHCHRCGVATGRGIKGILSRLPRSALVGGAAALSLCLGILIASLWLRAHSPAGPQQNGALLRKLAAVKAKANSDRQELSARAAAADARATTADAKAATAEQRARSLTADLLAARNDLLAAKAAVAASADAQAKLTEAQGRADHAEAQVKKLNEELATTRVVAYAPADSKAPNPVYRFWAKYKVGSTATMSDTTTITLVELTAQKAVIESRRDRIVTQPPVRWPIPSEIDAEKAKSGAGYFSDQIPWTDDQQGDEEVTVLGKDLKCHWAAVTRIVKPGDPPIRTKAWFSETVPGGLVRIRVTNLQTGIATDTNITGFKAAE